MRSLMLAALVTTAALPLIPSSAGAAPVKSLLEIREERVVIQKWDLSCGAATLATLLAFQHHDPVSEKEVATGLIEREEYVRNPRLVQLREGFSLLDLKRYVDRRGYIGTGLGGLSLDDLPARAPIILPLRLHGYNHFVVFRGVHANSVLLADPAWGNRTMPVADFERAWIEFAGIGKVGFTVTREHGTARPNLLAPREREFLMVD